MKVSVTSYELAALQHVAQTISLQCSIVLHCIADLPSLIRPTIQEAFSDEINMPYKLFGVIPMVCLPAALTHLTAIQARHPGPYTLVPIDTTFHFSTMDQLPHCSLVHNQHMLVTNDSSIAHAAPPRTHLHLVALMTLLEVRGLWHCCYGISWM
jgi:hypothetical protein